MKISIDLQLLDGNLGDYWKDNYEAAKAFKDYIIRLYTEAINSFYTNVDLDINIDIEKNTTGEPRGLSIDIIDGEFIDKQIIDGLLPDLNNLWSDFNKTDIAKSLSKED